MLQTNLKTIYSIFLNIFSSTIALNIVAAFRGMHVLPAKVSNIAILDYLESVTTGQTDRWTDRQTPDKVIPMCHCVWHAT